MLSESRFIRACRREEVDATPVWFMRQAGRYMPEYREVRAKYTMLEALRNPEVCHAITMQPINAFNLDAAIIFADLLPPLIGMGVKLDFVKGEGPQIENPLRTTRDIDMLGVPPAVETMPYALEAIRSVVSELNPRGVPLIGFAGAPFTLASYAVEGGGSKNYEYTKALMYNEPAAWKRLMTKLSTVVSDFVAEQVKAGVSAIQIFDSWVGALSPYDFSRFVAPYTKMVIEAGQKAGVPVIYFSTGSSAMLDVIAAMGSDVVGVDWRIGLGKAWREIGYDRAIQGNLDPLVLQAPWHEVEMHTDDILQQAERRPGFIFNLGHGILPGTPVETVRRLADYVHEKTSRVALAGVGSQS